MLMHLQIFTIVVTWKKVTVQSPVVIPAGMPESSARDGEIDRRTRVWSNGDLIDYPKRVRLT